MKAQKKRLMFNTVDDYRRAMDIATIAIEEWNEERGLTSFDPIFEAQLFLEELQEVVEASTLAELFCELADCHFVLKGSQYKLEMSELTENYWESLEQCLDLIGKMYIEQLNFPPEDFGVLFYNALVVVIDNNYRKPLQSKDENGKVVKGKRVKNPVTLFKPICEELGYDPEMLVTTPKGLAEEVQILARGLAAIQ